MNHWMTQVEITELHLNDVIFLASQIICVCGPKGECTYCKAKGELLERLRR
jgi:hypothetical protein